jgi:VanZ family protein
LALSGLDELHQATLPGRVADIYDFMFDTVAAGLIIAVLERNKFALNEIQRRTNKA